MKTSLAVAFLLLAGCAASYQVAEDTDKFSDPTKPIVRSMQNNSIDFHDPLQSVPSSQLNGFVARDRTSGKVIYAGFDLMMVNDGPSRWLTIRPGDEAVFLVDGERVVAVAISSSIDHNVKNLGAFGTRTDYFDYARYRLTPEQFKKIATAQKLEFKINGKNGSAIFPSGRSILESFQHNLRQFYDGEIAPFL